MRPLITLLAILALVSCDKENERDELFKVLYKQKFRTTNETTVEFIDSTICIILLGADTINGMTKGTWRIGSNLTGTFLYNNITVDSVKTKLKEIKDDTIIFKYQDRDIEFIKIKAKPKVQIIGHWKCTKCDSFPPYKNQDRWRQPIYDFDVDGNFKISDEEFNQKGTWSFSPSGQLILLNKFYKYGDAVKGELLIIHEASQNRLTISYKDKWGTIVTKELERVKN